jgi:hypothetical protein
MKDEKEQPHFEQHEYFSKIFDETRVFTESLLKENERLRKALLKIKLDTHEQQKADTTSSKLALTEAENTQLKQKLFQLEQDLAEVEQENREFAERYISIEQQNNNLASLYVASYRLHATLRFSQVVTIIKEIIVNLIGSEVFGIYLAEEKGRLLLCESEGLNKEKMGEIPFDEGIEGNVARSGEGFFLREPKRPGETQPVACVPLRIHDECIGVIAIYELLGHKKQLEALDFELCSLLASHAATAIYSAQLFSQVERKLDTYKDLMALITSS